MKNLDRKTVKEFQKSYKDFKQAFIDMYRAYKPDAKFNEATLSFRAIGIQEPYSSIDGILRDFKSGVFDKEEKDVETDTNN